MSRRLFIILAVIFLLSSSVAVYADVIMGNNFQWQNIDKLQELDRTRFCINGTDGYVTLKDVPGSKENVVTYYGEPLKYENGKEIPIGYVYICEGEYWGVIPPSHYTWYPGWIPMNHLLVVYVAADFERENEDKYYTYSGDYKAVYAAERIVIWAWPGSDREKRVIDDERFILKSVDTKYAYKDNEEREWGYVVLTYSYPGWDETPSTTKSEGWICLSDPANSHIPSSNPSPKPVKWSPDGIYEWVHDNTDAIIQYSLSNIIKVRTYEQDKTFSDIYKNVWYRDAIATSYEYGIIEGRGDNKFAPSDHLTGSEAIIIAARIHSQYKYGKEAGDRLLSAYNYTYYSGSGWSDPLNDIIQYCTVEGFISEFPKSYRPAPITRAQMVHAWSNILQSKDMKKQNTVSRLPDVDESMPYAGDIVLFYEAGILGGVDSQGTFDPDSNITRAEAATVFMKLIDVNKRHNGRIYGNAKED